MATMQQKLASLPNTEQQQWNLSMQTINQQSPEHVLQTSQPITRHFTPPAFVKTHLQLQWRSAIGTAGLARHGAPDGLDPLCSEVQNEASTVGR
jgi:hypothetical protein